MCPTWSAIYRNMLVPWERHVIYSWNISPIPICRQIVWLDIFIRLFTYNMRWSFLWWFSLADLRIKERWFFSYIILTNCSSVSNIISPCICRHCPIAISFNTHIICSSHNIEKTFITPVLSPRISCYPIISSVRNSPSNDRNLVLSVILCSCLIIKYSPGVVNKCLCYRHSTDNRSSLLNFVHHILFST